MTFHPIEVLDRVTAEYQDYLRSEFCAKEARLREALERELDQPGFIAQEPFFSAHRPFALGKAWKELLPRRERLAQVMAERAKGFGAKEPERAFLHQSTAIEHLLGEDAGPLVVTTGTGSGKTEAFLLPVIDNALADADRHGGRTALTAILVYPMNALANDQEERIKNYLEGAGAADRVFVARYDQTTSADQRRKIREAPPRILLTNYVMLEYLLVRKADRDAVFKDHRCRFLVLDEVHTYRGSLGANIALLVRRLRAHLEATRVAETPDLLPIGTSATIKSLGVDSPNPETRIAERDDSVRHFFGTLVGVPPASIKVVGESIEGVRTPPEACYAARPPGPQACHPADDESIRQTLVALSGLPPGTGIDNAARRCRILWDLNRWLTGLPASVSGIVERIRAEVAERKDTPAAEIRAEVQAALVAGAALPDGTPGALRLRAHRMFRGGWQFHRCIDPACGRLYPKGEERCTCGCATAPLYLCRNCGADYLRFTEEEVGENDHPTALTPARSLLAEPEWLLMQAGTKDAGEVTDDTEGETPEDDDDRAGGRAAGPASAVPAKIKGRPVLAGSFDPATGRFSPDPDDHPLHVLLAPARTRCLSCGGTAGSRSVITPVALGTSAAVKVVAEGVIEALSAARDSGSGGNEKDRLLVFSDSRQDAAHQARFLIFASRYDRMRRRVVQLLQEHGPLSIGRLVELLGDKAIAEKDNPCHRSRDADFLSGDETARIRAWEEAPLLDDLAVTAGYRGTLVNLGIIHVRYRDLDRYVDQHGGPLAGALGVARPQLVHLLRCVLDNVRHQSALSREMLRYHPRNAAFPEVLRAAEWERTIKSPHGLVATREGRLVAWRDPDEFPEGIKPLNPWRRPESKRRGPRLQTLLENMLGRIGGNTPASDHMERILEFLRRGSFLAGVDLHGGRQKARLFQVNAEAIDIVLADAATRRRCGTCLLALAGATTGSPCPRCHGMVVEWPDAEIDNHRSVRRIRSTDVVPLLAGEHTAQVPSEDRIQLEAEFKGGPQVSKRNILACSPTLEMGIDVGGLDAVLLRNVPPRPDNYAQRGGRAGRRARVGLVLGYARATPHDQYFYENPAEMIAGEIPAPVVALGNRDAILRHLNAVVLGGVTPGLSGRMVEYVTPMGEIQREKVDELLAGLRSQATAGLQTAICAFGKEVLGAAALDEASLKRSLEGLPDRVLRVFERTARQVKELRRSLESFHQHLRGTAAAGHAAKMIQRLLGIDDRRAADTEADDRSSGYPMRRFAEFGILPGYEFPTEPGALRLLNDEHEEDPVTTARRFGIAQYEPEAQVFARARRWRVAGLDIASPWNPGPEEPGVPYRKCEGCNLKYDADHPRCPRCRTDNLVQPLRAAEYGGFIARRDEKPVLEEEDRFAAANRVRMQPQWDGEVAGRWTAGPGWDLRWSRRETAWWVNEGPPPSEAEKKAGLPRLHDEARGFMLCRECGQILHVPRPKGRRRKNAPVPEPGPVQAEGHWEKCRSLTAPISPIALLARGQVDILRLTIPVPEREDPDEQKRWAVTLGYSLRLGIRHFYMLDGPEIEFELEGPWKAAGEESPFARIALSFIDPSLGGTGYLERAAREMHLVAKKAIDHLDHSGCETACYRCLKSYQNQRLHGLLEWPLALPFLEALAAESPASRSLEPGDTDDPRPWLEAYAAGVGSPLELKFLRLFEAHGFRPVKQHPIAPQEGGRPITVADFAVPERRLAIYVDGASVHVGAVLRRDRYLRDKLRKAILPWHVEELRAADLGLGAALVARLSGTTGTSAR